jgi:membrane protein implicated in regulation of membrane protease activity
MAAWSVWLILAGIAVLCELMSGTFYLLMIAVGFVIAALAAYIGVSIEWQILVAAIIALIGTLGLRRTSLGRRSSKAISKSKDALLDIGQTVMVSAWEQQGDLFVAQVKYRGAMWRALLLAGNAPSVGLHTIDEIRGSDLYVTPQR